MGGGGFLAVFKKKKKKLSHKLIIFGVLTLIFVIFLDFHARPTIINMCKYHLDQFASTKISEAITKSIEELDYNYNDYIKIETTDSGKILAIHTNARQITIIHNNIMDKIGRALEKFNSEKIDIHIGSLSGVVWLSGFGPIVSIKVTPKGKASSEIISNLQEAGINQTLHQIRIKITATIAGFIPGYSTEIQTKSEYILAESLIVGSVPNYYTKIISSANENLSDMHKCPEKISDSSQE